MWLQEPGSFTRIIAAMVAPRNTSSETMRSGRAAAARAFDAGAEMVSAVAMARPSNGGDSTTALGMLQRRDDEHPHKQKTWPGGGARPRLLPEGRNFREPQERGARSGAGCPPRRTARGNSSGKP